MHRDEFLFGKMNYKYQPSSCVNFSNAVSTQSIPVLYVYYSMLYYALKVAINMTRMYSSEIVTSNVMYCLGTLAK